MSFLKNPLPFSGRFRVDDVIQDHREDCYIATLHINQADVQDSRPYYLVVENDRGGDRHSIVLKVEGLFPGEFLRGLNPARVQLITFYDQ